MYKKLRSLDEGSDGLTISVICSKGLKYVEKITSIKNWGSFDTYEEIDARCNDLYNRIKDLFPLDNDTKIINGCGTYLEFLMFRIEENSEGLKFYEEINFTPLWLTKAVIKPNPTPDTIILPNTVLDVMKIQWYEYIMDKFSSYQIIKKSRSMTIKNHQVIYKYVKCYNKLKKMLHKGHEDAFKVLDVSINGFKYMCKDITQSPNNIIQIFLLLKIVGTITLFDIAKYDPTLFINYSRSLTLLIIYIKPITSVGITLTFDIILHLIDIFISFANKMNKNTLVYPLVCYLIVKLYSLEEFCGYNPKTLDKIIQSNTVYNSMLDEVFTFTYLDKWQDHNDSFNIAYNGSRYEYLYGNIIHSELSSVWIDAGFNEMYNIQNLYQPYLSPYSVQIFDINKIIDSTDIDKFPSVKKYLEL